MIEFDLRDATHHISPERLRASYVTQEVLDTILNWLHPYTTDYIFNPNTWETTEVTLDKEDYLFGLYFDREGQRLGVLAGDVPTTRAIIDLKEGTFTEQVSFPGEEGTGSVTELEPEVLDYLRTLCEDLSNS